MSSQQIDLSTLDLTIVCPIMGSKYADKDFAALNLDKDHLQAQNITSEEDHKAYHQKIRDQSKSTWLIGGYMERRDLYKSDLFASDPSSIREIHLGIDIWGDQGSLIHAPIDGEIHSFAYNGLPLDYGYTLILKHEIGMYEFYTLYGHLGRKYFNSWREGAVIKAGDPIGTFGAKTENGGWLPHLHFQVIQDMQGKRGDYPGVCSLSDLTFYSDNCPDPTPLIVRG